MNCPKCQHEFADSKLDGIPIQACSSCNGLWFDRAKIKEYVGQALEQSGQSPVLATLRELEPVPTELICPACQHQSLRSIKPHGVEIEQCTGCRSFVQDGEEKTGSGRQTFVFLNTEDGWKPVHEHGTPNR